MSSYSSYLISKMAVWRNPLGSEENWLKDLDRDKSFPTPFKMKITSAAFLSISIIAIVESVANVIFVALTSLLTVIRIQTPYDYSCKRLNSSTFSIMWALNLFFRNKDFANLCTNETSARICGNTSTQTATPQMQGKARMTLEEAIGAKKI
jgi:hypothetical protein